MTICPIALAVGCEKCPAFKFCTLTTVLGDQEKEDEVDASPMTSAHDRDWSEAISQKETPLHLIIQISYQQIDQQRMSTKDTQRKNLKKIPNK